MESRVVSCVTVRRDGYLIYQSGNSRESWSTEATAGEGLEANMTDPTVSKQESLAGTR